MAALAEAHHKNVRSTWAISLLTMASRILGYAKFVFTVQMFSSMRWVSDAFFFAFRIPNLFRNLLGEGALSAAFLPVFVKENEQNGKASASRIASQVSTLLALVGLVVTAVGIVIALFLAKLGESSENASELTLAMRLTALFMVFMPLSCLAALLSSMLNGLRRFSLPACISIIINIGFLSGFAYVYWWECGGDLGNIRPESVYTVAVFVLAAGVVEFLIQIPALFSLGIFVRPTLKFDHPGLKIIAKGFAPTALGLGLVQINAFVDSLIAGSLALQSPGALTYLEVGLRFMQLPLGVFGVAIATASFPEFASAAASKDDVRLLSHMVRSIRMSAFFLLPAAAVLIAMADPIIRLTCQRPDLEFGHTSVYRSVLTLSLYCLGLLFFSVRQILVRVYYARGDYSYPVKVAAAMVVVNLVLNLLFINFPDLYRLHFHEYFRYWNISPESFPFGLRVGEAGLALATFVTAILDSGVLWLGIRKHMGGALTVEKKNALLAPLYATLARMAVTAAAVGVLTWLFRNSIPYYPDFVSLLIRALVPCLLAAGAFYIIAIVLPLPELREFFFSVFRKTSRTADKSTPE